MIRKLLTIEEAKRVIEANFRVDALEVEVAVLMEAYNRVLAEDIVADFEIPSFDLSIVGGYAVRAADVFSASEDVPLTLKVVDYIATGEIPKTSYAPGDVVEVAAGVPLPDSTDAVVAFENAERDDDAVHFFGSVAAGENVRRHGSDIQKGAVVFKEGQVLGAAEIGVLAALGLGQVKVKKLPIIAVFSIGEEVSELVESLPAGKNFDVSGYCLCTAVMECGGKPFYFGVVPDELVSLRNVLDVVLSSSDMILVCGGLNVIEVMSSSGKPGLIVNGVAAKPGKSFSAAFVDKKPILLLPNEPSAALLMYHLFARSIVQRLAGRPVSGLRSVAAFASAHMFSAKGSRTFALVKLMFDEKCRLIAEPIKSEGSVSTLIDTDGFVEIAENEAYVNIDQQVTVQLFRGYAGRT